MQANGFFGPVFRHIKVEFPDGVVQVRLYGLVKLFWWGEGDTKDFSNLE